MGIYYRLTSNINTLPKHWAYTDAWEFVCDQQGSKWQDNRIKGFQVFGQAQSLLRKKLEEWVEEWERDIEK